MFEMLITDRDVRTRNGGAGRRDRPIGGKLSKLQGRIDYIVRTVVKIFFK